MHRDSIFVALVCCFAFFSALKNPVDAQTPLKMHALKGKPEIDGELDPVWNKTEVVATFKIAKSESSIPASECAYGHFRCLWNEGYLYILADVVDSALSTKSGNAWEQDSIEVFLDENKQRSRGFQPDDGQYRISAAGKVSTGGFATGKNVRCVAKKTKQGYLIEAAFKLHTTSTTANAELGIEFQVNNDGGTGKRVSLTKWNHAENDAWHTTANYGTVQLVVKLPDGIATKASELKPSKPTDSKTNRKKPGSNDGPAKSADLRVPDWVADAIFYQIFPERFRNGDKANDPTRESLEFPNITPKNWQVSPWTAQWYQRAEWEKKLGDSFYDGVFHRRYGGDLQGVIDKLDYLSDLGINTIYFNPVFYARSLHKYDGNSFHHIDPHFGPDPNGDFEMMRSETAEPSTWRWTAADKLFLKLLNDAHKKGIRVIIDGVFNHTGRDFFAFQDIVKKQQDSPYIHWYMIESFDDPATKKNEFKYKGWWGVDTLPEFANSQTGEDLHPDPKAYVMTATRRWMDPNGDGDPSDGIDGWRLDVANEVPNQFWRDWNALVRTINPEAYTVAEIWENAGQYLEDCGFSATMNYHGFAFPVKGFLVDGRLAATRFGEMLRQRMNEHAPKVQFALQNLIDSHDTDRVASMIVNARRGLDYRNADRFDYDLGERASPRWDGAYQVQPAQEQDKQVLRLVALFQMTFVGAPMIYYGTEAGMDGGDDPDDRMPMLWDDLSYESRNKGPAGSLTQAYPIQFDRDLYDYYRELASVRTGSRALRRGTFDVVVSDDDRQTFGFTREFESERVLVVINRGRDDCLLSSKDLRLAENETLTQMTASQDGSSVAELGDKINVPGLSGIVWKIEKR